MFQSERQTLEKFLGSVSYPTGKKQIIDQAQQKDLPTQLIAILGRLDDRQYTNLDDVESVLAAHKA